MAIARLQVGNFRCLQQLIVEPGPANTLIVGPNGAGKTSLLEAIFFLGRGRSFRHSRTRALIRDGETALRVGARLTHGQSGTATTLTLDADAGGIVARHDASPVDRLGELARLLPVQVIDPEIHKLVEEGPVWRRRFIDWGTFQAQPAFLAGWQQFRRTLRQRTAAVREKASGLAAWDDQLARAGEIVAAARQDYLDRLAPYVGAATASLLGHAVTLRHVRGWPADATLAEALAARREADSRAGLTTVGPHRADVRIEFAGQAARQRVSRGQQKLLGAALIVAQIRLLAEDGQEDGVLLVDDPAAELDGDSREALVAMLLELPVQRFFTALTRDAIPVPDDTTVQTLPIIPPANPLST